MRAPSDDSSQKASSPDVTEDYEVGGYSIADQPTYSDTLGFQPYVEAMAAFLKNPLTSTPLTVSIEGKWGSGKSSFMRQLQHRLLDPENAESSKTASKAKRMHAYTVWFNAWRHDKQEALWAAFALVVMKQMQHQSGFWRRQLGNIRLFRMRVNGVGGWVGMIATTAFWWLLIVIGAVAIIEIYVRGSHQTLQLLARTISHSAKEDARPALSNSSNWSPGHYVSTMLLTMIGFFLWWKQNVNNPLEMKLQKFLSHPDYHGSISFIENFHEDFQHLLSAYLGSGRLFVFVDDLDRCADSRVYDLLQALNLMIGNEGHVVFLIGMDREKVAALITQKVAGLLPFLPTPKGKYPNDADYGFVFLEKFVQIPFKVPTPSFAAMTGFVSNICGGSTPEASDTSDTTGKMLRSRMRVVNVVLGSDSPLVAKLAMICAPFLDKNPRRVKQFVNVFRLQAYIAATLGLLDYDDKEELSQSNSEPSFLTMEQIGKFIAITLRWPNIINDLSFDPQLINTLSAIAEGAKPATEQTQRVVRWESELMLLSFLQVCVSTGGWRYSLKNAPVGKLLDISPRRVAERLKPFVIMESPESDVVLGHGDSEDEAWKDAAERLEKDSDTTRPPA